MNGRRLITRGRLFITAGALFGASGVLLGALGAHGSSDVHSTWETAVHYQLIHALALLLVGVLAESNLRSAAFARYLALQLAGWFFLAGILLFSGSLYVLALGGSTLFGPVTPIGGVAFITGWLALAASTVRLEPAAEE